MLMASPFFLPISNFSVSVSRVLWAAIRMFYEDSFFQNFKGYLYRGQKHPFSDMYLFSIYIKLSLSMKILSINNFTIQQTFQYLLNGPLYKGFTKKFCSKVINTQAILSYLLKYCLLSSLQPNFFVSKTPIERSLRSLLRSLLVKLMIDNIFIERLGLSVLSLQPTLLQVCGKVFLHSKTHKPWGQQSTCKKYSFALLSKCC